MKEDFSLARERIGILGGAFDPIHQGHVHMASSALDSCRLDQLGSLTLTGSKKALKALKSLYFFVKSLTFAEKH